MVSKTKSPNKAKGAAASVYCGGCGEAVQRGVICECGWLDGVGEIDTDELERARRAAAEYTGDDPVRRPLSQGWYCERCGQVVAEQNAPCVSDDDACPVFSAAPPAPAPEPGDDVAETGGDDESEPPAPTTTPAGGE